MEAAPRTDRPALRAAVTAALALTVLWSAPAPARAAAAEPSDDAVAALTAEIRRLRDEYETRIAELERRLAELEEESARAVAGDGATDETARLRQAAAAAAAAGAAGASGSAEPAVGLERNLNRLNPEISFTGIVVGRGSDRGREEFQAQEFELDLQTALDPFSRTRWTLAVSDEGVEVEEGYILYSSLPGGLELTAGKFRQRFGPLNRQHLHALPQTDYPLVYQAFFGEEGLAQTGLSFAWLLPRPWADANEIAIQVTDGENEVAFGGESFDKLSLLVRLKNYWDLSPATYLEWGLSGVSGRTAGGGDSRVLGTDLTLSWQPPARARYRALTWRTELLRSTHEDEASIRHAAWGGYTYLEALLRQNLWVGVRLDRVEDPFAPESRQLGIKPYVTWWQSEWVRLRAELGRLRDELRHRDENRFALQLTWAAGPHKHDTY